MEGPDGSRHYCRADYKDIIPNKSFGGLDAFCDEQGNINTGFPRMFWKNEFHQSGSGTIVEIEITYASVEDLEKIVRWASKKVLLLRIITLMNC
jgi:hypothetical protein